MRVLVIGSGGREHAIVRALSMDPAVIDLHAAPGNPGIAELATLHEVTATDPRDVTRLALHLAVDLVVIGPEAPLVAGVGDVLREYGIAVFGPDAAAARIEGSKAFAKEVMAQAGIPTAPRMSVDTPVNGSTLGPPFNIGGWANDEPYVLGGTKSLVRYGSLLLQDRSGLGTAALTNWGSAHPGTAQFVYADGSVHSLTVAVNNAPGPWPGTILQWLLTRNKGETLPDTAY